MTSWCGSWPTAAPRPSARRAERTAIRALLAALVLSAAVPAPGLDQPPRAASPADALEEARRRLREGETDPAVLRTVAEAGGLYRVRAKLLAAASALEKGERAGVEANLAGLPPGPLGLDGLPAFLRAAVSGGTAELVAFASGAGDGPLARAALLRGARQARDEAERSAVRGALARLAPDAAHPRATIAWALARARVAATREETRALLTELAEAVPDAAGRASDLFESAESEAFRAAARQAAEPARLARARALAPRDPDEALRLASSLPKSPENRLALAELALSAGRAGEARRALERPSLLRFPDAPAALHVRALLLAARLRDETRAGTKRHARKQLPLRGSTAPPRGSLRVPDADEAELEALLAAPLTDPDRGLLLLAGLRLALVEGRTDEARRRAEELIALDPSSTAGAEELFLEAFTQYRRGVASRRPDDVRDAARRFEEQAALYREVAARRRATYWAGKARAAAGEAGPARSLWAGLVSGTSSDLYGRWAAAALGVPLAPPALPADAPEPTLPPDRPAAPSRELLACGLPGLAEDAAEREGSLSPEFAALAASERGDHRRAASLLKGRYPQLGTPEEGAVPLAARRAFYPLGASRVLLSAAEESGVPPALLFALVRQESLFQPAVRSHAGAVGLLQVMPATGRFLQRLAHERGRPDLRDPATNARLGASYLARLLELFEGDATAALAAYNAGPGRVIRWRREAEGLSSDEFLESIPLSEPRDYVRRVLFFEGAYAALYGIPAGPLTPSAGIASAPAP